MDQITENGLDAEEDSPRSVLEYTREEPALIDIEAANDKWTTADLDTICRAAVAALQSQQMDRVGVELAIRLSDNDEVQILNRDYRGKDKPTNVLSFPNFDQDEITIQKQITGPAPMPLHLGDLVLAHGVLSRECQEQNKLFPHHLMHLIVHGVLHLLGDDHITDEEAEIMEQKERQILAELGVTDPYSERS